MYLLDTVVLSELRKRHRDPNVVRWIGAVQAADLFVSTATVAEVERGIERLRVAEPKFATELAAWLDIVLRVYAERILPLTTNVARRWGRLAAHVADREMHLAVAATALEYGLIVATRDVADFAPTGVVTFNPFDPGPPQGT
jgi:predicted nucleic acid-binding protein